MTADHKKERNAHLVAMAPGPIVASAPLVLDCIKIGYPNEDEAEKARTRWGQAAVYLCKLCGAWHTTKIERFRKERGGR